MKSYDLVIHKEIVRLLKAEGLDVRDTMLESSNPIVYIANTEEVTDNTKTFERNLITYTVKMWGSENGSIVEIKQLKAKVVQALSEGVYAVPGYIIDNITVDNVATFKELESAKNNANGITYFYQSILNISYIIKEDI